MKEYTTNRSHRCELCKGREVITLEDGIYLETSLVEKNGLFYCRNKKECKQNIDAENTIVDYEEGEDGKPRMTQVTKYGKSIMEVDYDT